MDELELLIIQPTPFCNINCDYCYLPFRHNTAVMTQEVLAATLQRAFESSNLGSSLTIVWHAGEPFVVPLEFYRNAWSIVTELAPPNCDVHFSFQTNGTLITPAWCAFIRHTRSRVGLSIDGPPYIHDQQRKYRSGKGTHKDAMKGVAHLKAHGIPFHIISVVSRVSLPYARELYFFMKDTGCPAWAFNIEALHGDNRRRSFADAADDGDIRSFVRELFTLWYNDATRPRIREFDGLLHAIREGKTAKMQEARPFAIVNVGVDGNFSTFSPELHGWDTSYGRMVLGNVLTDQLYAGTASESFLRARTAIDRGVDECRKVCEYFDLCGGGSPSSKFFETGRFDVSRTRFCQTQKIIVIDEVLAVLENHIKQRALADAQH